MFIIIKIAMVIAFILIAFILVAIGKWGFRFIDKITVGEKKEDLEHQAEIANDVKEYLTENKKNC